jgi:hypothetical protein
MAKVKEKGMLNLGGVNNLTKKVKKQNPKKNIDKLGGPLPGPGTGINVITGTTYQKKKKGK